MQEARTPGQIKEKGEVKIVNSNGQKLELTPKGRDIIVEMTEYKDGETIRISMFIGRISVDKLKRFFGTKISPRRLARS